MWRFAGASIVGRSHQRQGRAGQDVNRCEIVKQPNGSELFVACVADGAGSAARGEVGARAACESFFEFFQTINQDEIGSARCRFHPGLWSGRTDTWLAAFQSAIAAQAERDGLAVRDYACTFLGAVLVQDRIGLVQIGDGAIVLSTEDRCCPYQTFVWPQRGEYANETYFATDPAASEILVGELIERRIDEIALFTDGLQGLVLDDRQRLPHAPFFERVFAPVRAAPPGHAERLSDALAAFLASPRVQARTDDDLTLILATRRDGAAG